MVGLPHLPSSGLVLALAELLLDGREAGGIHTPPGIRLPNGALGAAQTQHQVITPPPKRGLDRNDPAANGLGHPSDAPLSPPPSVREPPSEKNCGRNWE